MKPVKLLLDENLSPKVSEALGSAGVDVCHARDRDLLGASDAEVLDRAFTEDRVLVTSNVEDFAKLARARELHCGIVLVEDGQLLRHEQLDVVRRAIEAIEQHGDMANTILRIARDGTFELGTSWPPSRTEGG